MLKACIGLNCARQIDYIDRRHCSLSFIPDDVYRHERTLEELLLDSNALQELPPKFFRLINLRRLTLSENDINRVPPGIANLTRLVELDLSKNAIEDIPQNLQFCRSLSHLDISSNPLLRTPESLSSISTLTQLCISDTAIPRLPMEIGNLKNLMVIEARENMLKTLPRSVCQCKKLRRLDVGNNEIDTLPEDIGNLAELVELWLDSNMLSKLPESVTRLSNLAVLDVTKNRLERLPAEFAKLTSLSDLHLSENCIESLPQDLGNMRALTLVKLDFNHLTAIPESIGKLNCVTELLLFDNMVENVPATLFEMRSLEMLNLDRNHLMEIPSNIGQCRTLHVLSLRENELLELPETIGQLDGLRVLDIAGNRLQCLPISMGTLKLDALWVDGGQPQPLVALVPEPDPEDSEKKRLTCSFFPQHGPHNTSMENFLDNDSQSSDFTSNGMSLKRNDSFGRGARLGVAFDPALGPGPESDSQAKLVRFPTPFRKDMKALKAKRMKKSKYKPGAEPSTTIFRKGSSSQDDLTLLSVTSASSDQVLYEHSPPSGRKEPARSKSPASLGDFKDIVEQWNNSPSLLPGAQRNRNKMEEAEGQGNAAFSLGGVPEEEEGAPGQLSKMSGVMNLSQDELATKMDLVQGTPSSGTQADATPDLIKNAVHTPEPDVPSNSKLQTIEVSILLIKLPGRTLGFSIAGGRGSTPAYEDVDESIFVTKIAPGGLAEQDGRLRLGDKLVEVNSVNMMNATHPEAVTALKEVSDSCTLVVSREVLVILPDELSPMEPPSTEPPREEVTLYGVVSMPTSAEGGTSESEGEILAKKIVSDILDRSISRYSAELKDGEDERTVEVTDQQREGEKPAPSSHDNYVNYDIAQTVLESMARKHSASEGDQNSLPRRSENLDAYDDRSEAAKRASISLSLEEDEEQYEEERVVLDRSIGKLGLSIVGGADHVSRVFGQGRPGVYISKISKGGAAEATGRLRLGDRILEVNGMNVRYSTHQQAVQWLISQDGDIILIVRHAPQPDGLQEVTLVKSPSEKLGVSIRGGSKGSKGNPLDPDDEGIFISKLTHGGAAEKNKKLHVGQRLLEVNGVSLLGASHVEAVRALRSAPEKLYITVCDGYDPEEVLRRKAELAESKSEADNTDRASVSLSAISTSESLGGLDIALHNMLSASMDVLPQISKSDITPPNFAVSPTKKLARSSFDLNDTDPVTTEDLDKMLKGLAEFGNADYGDVAVETKYPRASTPPTLQDSIPLSEIVGSLQRGFTMADEDLADLSFMSDYNPPKDSKEEKKEKPDSPSLEDELAIVENEDPASLLEALDSEVSMMQDEVTLTEKNVQKEEEEQKKIKEEAIKSKQSKLTVPQKPALMVASPETRRRADQIKIEIPNRKGSEKAVQSIIGEVFDGVSFEEFEPRSGLSSGIATPTFRGVSPDSDAPASMEDLLSALKGIETNVGTKGQVTKDETPPKEEIPPRKEVTPPPAVEVVPFSRERANTNPPVITIESADGVASEVMLRTPSSSVTGKDVDRRKSAPPKVADKPNQTFVNPEKLSFQERLALHKRMADQGHPERPNSAKESLPEVKNGTNIDISQMKGDSISNHDQAHDSINSQTEVQDRSASPLESTLV